MEHEVYISREVIGLGHNESARLIKKAVSMAGDPGVYNRKWRSKFG